MNVFDLFSGFDGLEELPISFVDGSGCSCVYPYADGICISHRFPPPDDAIISRRVAQMELSAGQVLDSAIEYAGGDWRRAGSQTVYLESPTTGISEAASARFHSGWNTAHLT